MLAAGEYSSSLSVPAGEWLLAGSKMASGLPLVKGVHSWDTGTRRKPSLLSSRCALPNGTYGVNPKGSERQGSIREGTS